MLRRPLRPLLSLLLACALLLSLQGSLLHALGHAEEALSTVQHLPQGGKHPAGEQACTLCLAFAVFDAAAPSQASFGLLQPVTHISFITPAQHLAHSTLPHYRSRAPPAFLA
ncbi:hypothetical protein [Uliginosibacterium sp. 31-12]|uniref:hypothetical protein n=1 Tax=Uliginosibacterium sp. 31-12 TaxID=3062781 RepID=UPI0026E34D70|nr:hypothetical protein [Uliginosibacterium sp. 31-12]MDO6388057.1 hypothetical protein [Uliginosibacterium sp. 31-12]